MLWKTLVRTWTATAAASERAPGMVLGLAGVNGEPGLVVSGPDGSVLAVVQATTSSSGIVEVLVTRNPAKLTAWTDRPRPDDPGA